MNLYKQDIQINPEEEFDDILNNQEKSPIEVKINLLDFKKNPSK